VRHKVKAHPNWYSESSCLRLIEFRQSAIVGKAEAGSAGEQPARNNQLETHRHDEQGGDGQTVAPATASLHRIDRFPNASENSCFVYLRLQLYKLFLERDWRTIAQRRVQALAVVDRFDEVTNASAGFAKIVVLRAINLLVLEGFHK